LLGELSGPCLMFWRNPVSSFDLWSWRCHDM